MQARALADHLEPRYQTFVEDLRLLCGIDCGTHNKEGVDRVGAWVAERAVGNGWRVLVHPRPNGGDIVQATVPGNGTRRILLVAHMDTVYPDGTAAARPLRQEEDRLVGPGSCDMKAGLLAGIYAVEALQATNQTPFREVVLLFTGDEEIGSPEARELIAALAQDGDATLVVEPARLSGAVVGARKGVQAYDLAVRGRAAHAGVAPEQGRSAILEMAHKVIALQALNGTVPGATVNVGVVRGGTATNVVPDLAVAQIDVRGVEPEDLQAIDDAIRAIAATTVVAGTVAEITTPYPGFPPMARTPIVERMIAHAQAVAEEIGFTLDAVATGGASDASLVAGLGLPVLDGLGPVGGEAHSPNEYVVASSIVPRTALLAGLIARLGEQGV